MLHSSSTTEQPSNYRHLEKMQVGEIIEAINKEDKTIALAVEKALPQIEELIKAIVTKIKNGGRLFYIGAGTSGRLAVVDASECPPTFGVSTNTVIAIIAGGEKAIKNAVEFAEDNIENGWNNLMGYNISPKDFVVGVSASGTAPYVAAALENCRKNSTVTGCIVCNKNSVVASFADYAAEIITGPEFITGSTRMKAGTAQKMVLNMISTATMIQLGRVEDNKMVNMELSNSKLIDRGVRMLMDELNLDDYQKVKDLLLVHGNVKKVLENFKT